jgi:hypothetical protein
MIRERMKAAPVIKRPMPIIHISHVTASVCTAAMPVRVSEKRISIDHLRKKGKELTPYPLELSEAPERLRRITP